MRLRKGIKSASRFSKECGKIEMSKEKSAQALFSLLLNQIIFHVPYKQVLGDANIKNLLRDNIVI